MPTFTTKLPYATFQQQLRATARFELASGWCAQLNGESFELVELEDEDGAMFAAIFAVYDRSGDYIDFVDEREAREVGLL